MPTLQELLKDFPLEKYFEPFLGGGAIFFSIQPNKAFLSDLNADLINAYIQVKENVEEVISGLLSLENSSQKYYEVRASTETDPLIRAIYFIFLNHTSYNGLYRVNNSGKYNVPYGNRSTKLINTNNMRRVSMALRLAEIECISYEHTIDNISEGDLVYLDPPYTVSHNRNGFIKYNKKLFSLADQYKLSKFIDQIKLKGAFYILSNGANDKISEIFHKDGDNLMTVKRSSVIGGKNAIRSSVEEYLFTNLPSRGERCIHD